MTKPQKFTAEQIIEACKGTGGIKAVVAKKLHCSRETICNYAKKYITVQRALDQADQEATDLAESKFLQMINAEHWPAIKYRLATKGKDRGYTERQEITGAEGKDLIPKNTLVIIEYNDAD